MDLSSIGEITMWDGWIQISFPKIMMVSPDKSLWGRCEIIGMRLRKDRQE